MLIRGSKDSISFGEVLPEPGTETESFLLTQRDWQDFSIGCNFLYQTTNEKGILVHCFLFTG